MKQVGKQCERAARVCECGRSGPVEEAKARCLPPTRHRQCVSRCELRVRYAAVVQLVCCYWRIFGAMYDELLRRHQPHHTATHHTTPASLSGAFLLSRVTRNSPPLLSSVLLPFDLLPSSISSCSQLVVYSTFKQIRPPSDLSFWLLSLLSSACLLVRLLLFVCCLPLLIVHSLK